MNPNTPNVFTGQPTVAPGIIQHQPQLPTLTTVPQATGAFLGCPGGCEALQLSDVAPWVMPFWMKLASGAALITGIAVLAAVAARD